MGKDAKKYSPHSLSPFLDSLQSFRSNIDRRSRSQKIRLFCSLDVGIVSGGDWPVFSTNYDVRKTKS